MKIVAARVDMNRDLGNEPDLRLIIKDAPRPSEIEMTAHNTGKGQATYAGVKDGFCRFLHHDLKDERGYGGREFTIKLVGGETRTIKGPWSSRMSIMETLGYEAAVDVSYRRAEEIDAEKVFNEASDRLNDMRNRPFMKLYDDCQSVGFIDTAAYHRWADRYRAADLLHTKHRRALYRQRQPGDPQLSDPPRREWEGAPEQYALAYDLVLWEPGVWSGGAITVSVISEALERLCPDYVLYHKKWDKHGEIWWVPAPKSKLIYDTPMCAPKEEGFWGYAVTDPHGYPLTGFHLTLNGLLIEVIYECPTELQIRIQEGSAHVLKRDKGQWIGLTRKERRSLPSQLRQEAA